MEFIEILGFAGAVIIGISLGLIGGGGSILAVPILAYLFGFNETIATAYSLFIVGIASLVGGIRQHHVNKAVDWKTAIIFGIPAILGVWVIRHEVVPFIPNILFTVESFSFTRRMLMFGLFAFLMLVAAIKMIRPKQEHEGDGKIKYNYILILVEGLLVGGITGLVGAGGGFLIIPALVLLANMDIKMAIGTSLIIIAAKSILGFLLGDALTMSINWNFLAIFSALAIAGIFVGVYINQFINGKKLQTGFGYFILCMALIMFVVEFII